MSSRRLGNAELSYFLPSRADGVNDMYLHLSFSAPNSLVDPQRILLIWTLLRLRHPLLASAVHVHSYDDVHFVLDPPLCPEQALLSAANSFTYLSIDKDQLIDRYLNGPRILTSDHLSHLFLSSPNARSNLSLADTPVFSSLVNGDAHLGATDNVQQQFHILIAATHYIGDGMALHNFANDFFSLLAARYSTDPPSLHDLLSFEWQKRYANHARSHVLPLNLELRLPPPGGKCKQAIAKAEFHSCQRKLIGGHSFPGPQKPSERHTIVPTVSFSPERTKTILRSCKNHGVSISTAIFSLCAIVWSRMDRAKGEQAKPELPLMMYSALNMRPYLSHTSCSSAASQEHETYWFLAIGYFNVVLPAFLPKQMTPTAIHNTFWTRARSAKVQSTKAAKSPFVVPRSHVMSDQRAERAIRWAKEDDAKVNGAPIQETPNVSNDTPAPIPSQALIGLSSLGNLDGIYNHESYSNAGITLRTLTTGSRQRSGAMLLFAYTFAGRLWLSLGYDENGFDKGTVQRFWDNLQLGVGEFLENEP